MRHGYTAAQVVAVYSYLSEARENPDKYRFEVELEFVQCLGNPSYLNCERLSHDSTINVPFTSKAKHLNITTR